MLPDYTTLPSDHETGPVPGNHFNSLGLGNYGYLIGGSNRAFIGNLSTTWNGGNTLMVYFIQMPEQKETFQKR